MGVKGLYSFIQRQKSYLVLVHTIYEIICEIKEYQRAYNKRPKIIFNLRAFNNFFEQNVTSTIYGGRLCAVQREFENLLSALKEAGADLLFVSKDREPFVKENSNEDYGFGLELVENIEKLKSIKTLENYYQFARKYPWNELAIVVMKQSAKKFGEFRESACTLRSDNATAHTQVANDEDAFMVIGLNTSYLFYEGSWRFLYPALDRNSMVFKEFNKKKILEHLDLNIDQMRLLATLGGKLKTDHENQEVMLNYFGLNTFNGCFPDFHKVIDFIHRYAPRESFPLSNETIKKILQELIGFFDEELIESFKSSLQYELAFDQADESLVEINNILRNNPYALMAEKILNNIPVVIESKFLDVKADDMKSLQELTLPWIKRVCGVLLKGLAGPKARSIIYRVDEENFEEIQVEPEIPTFEIAPLIQLLNGKLDENEKYKMLAFLINNLIDEDTLKTIPKELIMDEIIVKHLVVNDSMTQREASAMMKTIKEGTPRIFIYPLEVNVRLFRISKLYTKMYLILLQSLCACGIEDFINELKIDFATFQNNFN